MPFKKYSQSKIDKVFQDINEFNKFIKTAGKTDKDFQKRVMKRIASLPELKENPDNFTLLRNRSISSREFWGPNQNWDAFPDKELRTKFSTFLDCRVDVDHICNDDNDIIGIVLDSIYVPPQIFVTSKSELYPYRESLVEEFINQGENIKIIGGYIENLLAIDNERAEAHTPGLVTAIKEGEVQDTSMGANVSISECSVCGNKARTENEFCDHILYSKGKKINFNGIEKLCYEINHGIDFFEDSIIISDDFARKAGKKVQAGGEGADRCAKILEIVAKKGNMLDRIKKKAIDIGQMNDEEYIFIGDEPEEVVEFKEDEYQHKKDKYSSILLNDKSVQSFRLENFIKDSKNYNEFESNVVGLVGGELSSSSKIKVRSFYENIKKESNKKDLLAIVKRMRDEEYKIEEIKSKLKKLNYSNDQIAEALSYIDYKNGYTKQASEDLNTLLYRDKDQWKKDDEVNQPKGDRGSGIESDQLSKPLFSKLKSLRQRLANMEEQSNCKDEDKMTKYNDDEMEEKISTLKERLKRISNYKGQILTCVTPGVVHVLNHEDVRSAETKIGDKFYVTNETEYFVEGTLDIGGNSFIEDPGLSGHKVRPGIVNQSKIIYGISKEKIDIEPIEEFFSIWTTDLSKKSKKDSLTNGTGWDYYGGMYNDKENESLQKHKTKDVENYKDHNISDKKYTTEPEGMVKQLKSLKQRLSRINPAADDLLEERVELNKGFGFENANKILENEDHKKSNIEKIKKKSFITKADLEMEEVIDEQDKFTWDEQDGKKEVLKVSQEKDHIKEDMERFKEIKKKLTEIENEVTELEKDDKIELEKKSNRSKIKNIKELILNNIDEAKDVLFGYNLDIDNLDEDLSTYEESELQIIESELVNDIYSDKMTSVGQTFVPTELQPGSNVKIKDTDTGQDMSQGQINNVRTEVTEDGKEETIVDLSDGKSYSTDNFNIDKQSMLEEIQNIDFGDSADHLDKLAKLEALSFDEPIEFDDNILEPEESIVNERGNVNRLNKKVRSGFAGVVEKRAPVVSIISQDEIDDNFFDD